MRRSLLAVPLFTVLLTAPPGWGQTLASLQGEVNTLKATVAQLTRYIQVIESTAALNGLTGPHVIITGANVHIRSGSGVTHKGRTNTDGAWVDNPVGLGNLILGYNEPGPDDVTARGGSHNLVIGVKHQYPNSGGLVAGRDNAVSGQAASVSGGWRNTASGSFASVSGGKENTASGGRASISGVVGNTASGWTASISGGWRNTASGSTASVSGGARNTANGTTASISGGADNTASGQRASISGGDSNTASGVDASVSGGQAITVAGVGDFSNRLPDCLTTEAVAGQDVADIVFEGCNVHVRNGLGRTDGRGAGVQTDPGARNYDPASWVVNGTGNLIIGYNEDASATTERDGSHNLVIGEEHDYTAYGSLVAGHGNTASGINSSISGGKDNTASGWRASISGGVSNTASGELAVVSGGADNTASGTAAVVSGGADNTASGTAAVVSGGDSRTASGDHDWRAGGLSQDN